MDGGAWVSWRDSGTPWERFVGWTETYHVRVFLGAFAVLVLLTLCTGWG